MSSSDVWSAARRVLTIGMAGFALLNVSYLLEQGFHFAVDQLRARPNARAVERWPEFASFFAEADAIRSFGRDYLGLEETGSYTRFVRTNKDHVAYIVSAVRPTSFERKVWRFPIVGTVPYLGFYRELAALRQAARLEAQGWETLVRRVGAFSSLGYFSDPLYSYMAGYHPERIASLLLHEMTHETVWFPHDAALNEAIATFVGNRGALAYLEHRYGLESPVYAEAVRRQTERDTFTLFMRQFATRLDELYRSGVSDAALRKDTIIADERARFETHYDIWFADESYRSFLSRSVNNAYVDLYRTYNSDLELIELLHASHGGDLAALVADAISLLGEVDARGILEQRQEQLQRRATPKSQPLGTNGRLSSSR